MATKHTSNELESLRHWLPPDTNIPDEILKEFLASLSLETFPSGSFFTRVGDCHDRVGFVLKGVFRVYYVGVNGETFIRNFCIEGRPIGSYATILTGKPAHVNIEALEDSKVLTFSYKTLEQRYSQHAGWERLGRKIAEDHYIARERREYHLLAFDAKQRHEMFLKDFPGLAARITQVNIASYLGISPETLSRINRKRRQT